MTELDVIEGGMYLVTGGLAGLASGLFGVGGGLIIVPVLYAVFSARGYPAEHLMHMAVATSLATIIITSLSSTLAHNKRQAVLWQTVFLLGPGIILGAGFGGIFASALENSVLTRVFAVFELIVAMHLLFKTQPTQHRSNINKLAATTGGLVIGFISAIVGIAGGTMTVPFLSWCNVSMHKAVATSAACGFPIALFGTLSYIYAGWGKDLTDAPSIGYLQLYALVMIAISSFIFAPLGAALAHAVSEKTLRLAFAFVLLLLSVSMFLR